MGISCGCVSSCDWLLVPLHLRVLSCGLLSRVSGMIVQSLSVQLVRKSTQLIVHQEHTILTGQGNSPLSSTFTRQEKLILLAQGTTCALSSHWVTSPISIRISRDVFQGLAQVVRSPCRYRQVEFQVLSSISALSWHVSDLQVWAIQVCVTNILSRTSNPVSLRLCTTVSQQRH